MIDTFGKGAAYYTNWRRMGDHTRHALGDVEQDCQHCHGGGMVDIHNDGRPWGNEKFRTCLDCAGQGVIWVEGAP